MDGFGSSILEMWPWLLWAIEGSLHPHRRVLDVGAGHGKAAILMAEYLNVKVERVDGLEPNVDHLAHRLAGTLYGEVWPTPVQDFDRFGDYDTVILADVIEHMPFTEGWELLERIPGQVIVSTPVDALAADNEGVPPLEQHVSQWRQSNLQATRRCEHVWLWPTCEDAHKPPRQYIARLSPLTGNPSRSGR